MSALPRTDHERGSEEWRRRLSQVGGVFALEVRKNLFGFRSLPIYLLAALPVALFSLWTLAGVVARENIQGLDDPGSLSMIFSFLYHGFILRFVLYIACVWVFMNLIRGEILDRSLHYYMLTPIRREVLMAGKFLSGILSTGILFGGATLLCFVLFYIPTGSSHFLDFVVFGPGLKQVTLFVAATILACIGYGSVFLLLGTLFRNPIIVGVLIWGWEFLNPFLPSTLKAMSVVYYISSVAPLPPSDSPFQVLAVPASPWIAVPGILFLSAAAILACAWRIRRIEITYSDE